MPQYPIPTDWDGVTWACLITEWPDSIEWFAILRGMMTTAQRGRFWDGSTGNIIDTQAIGLEIAERNPVSTCDDIVAQLTALVTAVEGMDVSSDLQVTIQTEIKNEITNVANAVALSVAQSLASSTAMSSAFAWSQAVAKTFVGVKITNNVVLQMRPVEPGITEPPVAIEEGDAGITPTLHSIADAEICKRCFWLVYTSWKIFEYLAAVEPFILATILSAGGAIADALEAVSNFVTGGTAFQILPASVLVQVAHIFASLHEQNILQSNLEAIRDWLSDVDGLACWLAIQVGNIDNTHDILGWVHDTAESSGGVDTVAIGLLNLTFNLSTLASLYFESPLLTIPAPAVLAGYDATCSGCEG